MLCLCNSSNARTKLTTNCTPVNYSKSLHRLKPNTLHRLMSSIEQQKQQTLDKQADEVCVNILGMNQLLAPKPNCLVLRLIFFVAHSLYHKS